MGSSKKRAPTPPPAPSPERIARTDAEFNRVDQFTPAGSLTFSGPNRNQATLEFDPRIQQNFDQQLALDNSLLNLSQLAIGGPSDGGQGLPGPQRALGGVEILDPEELEAHRQRQAEILATPEGQERFAALQGAAQQGAAQQGGITGLINNPLTTQGLPELQFGGQAPELQGIQGANLQQGVGGLDFSGAAGIPQSAELFRDQATEAFFDRSSGLLNRQFEQQEDALRQRLANQGIQPGSEAFSREIEDFNIQRSDALGRLANEATMFGGQEATRGLQDQLALRGAGTNEALAQFGSGLQAGQFGNQAAIQQFGIGSDVANQANQIAQQNLQNQAFLQDRQNAARSQLFNEQAAIRGNQFNELASLLGLQQTQTPGLSNFFGPSQVNTTDAFGLNQQAAQNTFNVQNQRQAAAKGATASLLGNLGGAFIGKPR